MTKNADLTEAVMDRIAEHMARRPVPPPEPKPTRGRPCKPSKPRAIGEAKSGEKPTPEREAHGRFTSDTIYAHATDGDGTVLTKRTVETRRRRDADADLRNLGRRFPKLEPHHVRAACLFEEDYTAAKTEPKVVANLQGAGVGGGSIRDTIEATLDDRNDFNRALKALRAGDSRDESGVVAVIESIVLNRSTIRAAGVVMYARARDQTVHVSTVLKIGLGRLAAHYTVNGRIAAARERAA